MDVQTGDRWDGWLKEGAVSMSTLLELIDANPDYYPQLQVGEKRVHFIEVDVPWFEIFFRISADRNRKLHAQEPDKLRVWVQGVALATIVGSVVSYAVYDAVASELPIKSVNGVSAGTTVCVGVELLSQVHDSKGVTSKIRVSLTFARGRSARKIFEEIVMEVIRHKNTKEE